MANGEILEVLVRGAAVGAFLGLAIAVSRIGSSSARDRRPILSLCGCSHRHAISSYRRGNWLGQTFGMGAIGDRCRPLLGVRDGIIR